MELLGRLGVAVRTHARIAEATREGLRLQDGQLVRGGVFVWAGGVEAPELVARFGLPTGHNGRVKVDQHLRALDHPEVYAAGDVASVVDPRSGRTLPPLAQVALEQAETVARNLHAELDGGPLEAFRFNDKGFIVSVGSRRASPPPARPDLGHVAAPGSAPDAGTRLVERGGEVAPEPAGSLSPWSSDSQATGRRLVRTHSPRRLALPNPAGAQTRVSSRAVPWLRRSSSRGRARNPGRGRGICSLVASRASRSPAAGADDVVNGSAMRRSHAGARLTTGSFLRRAPL
jgi:hypothetical protein